MLNPAKAAGRSIPPDNHKLDQQLTSCFDHPSDSSWHMLLHQLSIPSCSRRHVCYCACVVGHFLAKHNASAGFFYCLHPSFGGVFHVLHLVSLDAHWMHPRICDTDNSGFLFFPLKTVHRLWQLWTWNYSPQPNASSVIPIQHIKQCEKRHFYFIHSRIKRKETHRSARKIIWWQASRGVESQSWRAEAQPGGLSSTGRKWPLPGLPDRVTW